MAGLTFKERIDEALPLIPFRIFSTLPMLVSEPFTTGHISFFSQGLMQLDHSEAF